MIGQAPSNRRGSAPLTSPSHQLYELDQKLNIEKPDELPVPDSYGGPPTGNLSRREASERTAARECVIPGGVLSVRSRRHGDNVVAVYRARGCLAVRFRAHLVVPLPGAAAFPNILWSRDSTSTSPMSAADDTQSR